MVSTRTVLPDSVEASWRFLEGFSASSTRRRGLRILVVDDDQDHADSLATVLKLFGHEADTAYSGCAALEWTAAVYPDVILCDLAMPGMDGYTVVEHLREHPGLAGTTFIAASGYGSDGDCARARRAGFHLHLVKPLDLERLHEILADCPRRPVRRG